MLILGRTRARARARTRSHVALRRILSEGQKRARANSRNPEPNGMRPNGIFGGHGGVRRAVASAADRVRARARARVRSRDQNVWAAVIRSSAVRHQPASDEPSKAGMFCGSDDGSQRETGTKLLRNAS